MKDVLILTADKNAEFALKGLLPRITQIEGIRKFGFDIITHPHKDPGVANQSVEYVRPYINDYRYLIVMFDHEGCGKEDQTRSDLESKIESLLSINGWQDRNCCILLCPELESWLWVDATTVHDIIGWEDVTNIYVWIRNSGFLTMQGSLKPARPKEAFEAALRKCRVARSSSLYQKLTKQADYHNCIDPSFVKLLGTIKRWFAEI